MATGLRLTLVLSGAVIIAVGAIVLIGLSQQFPFFTQTGTAASLDISEWRIGHSGGPLLAPFYAAVETQASTSGEITAYKFNSGGDIGYALLSGQIDAGLIEPAKALRLVQMAGKAELRIAGSIQYPFGATVVVRKDLSIRLQGLEGRTVAAVGPNCDLKLHFGMDARERGVNTDNINFVFLPVADMVAALESKTVDAIVTKSAAALQAQWQGHKILYQNWQMKPGGDECCPAVLSQIEYFLVVRPVSDAAIDRLVRTLHAASQRPSAELRQITEAQLRLAPDALADFPMAYFSEIDDALQAAYKNWTWRPKR